MSSIDDTQLLPLERNGYGASVHTPWREPSFDFDTCTIGSANPPSPSAVLREARDRLFDHEPELMALAREIGEIVRTIPVDALHGQEPHALIVGGLVRDVVAGAPTSKDLDLEVYGVSMDSLIDALKTAYGDEKVLVEGESFQAIKLSLEGQLVDVTIPRRDSKSGVGHKGFVVEGDPSMTLVEAARRRDFTINGFAADPFTGEIFDPYDGCRDLIHGVLRVIDTDTFGDDPLRVYRGVQFAARMNLSIEPDTQALMREMVDSGMLSTLPRSRVTEEMHKLLVKAETPSRGLNIMRELGIIEKHWPELHGLIGVPQDPEWHPEGDVWTHTLLVVDAARRLVAMSPTSCITEQEVQEVMWAALAHDLGKRETTAFTEGRYRAHGHEAAGVEPAAQLLERIELHSASKRFVLSCVERHLSPSVLFHAYEKGALAEKGYANAVRKLLRDVGEEKIDLFLVVCEADHRGRTTASATEPVFRPAEAFRQIAQDYCCAVEARQLLITGKDLLELGLEPGKLFGQLQRQVEQARDDGLVTTKDEALTLVANLLTER